MSYYFDYGATSLKKPKEVADKVYEVLASAEVCQCFKRKLL